MKRIILWSTYYLATILVLLFLLEIGVRLFSSDVVTQGTDSSLLLEGRFGITPGLQPNARGDVFGKTIVIDENGFLQNKCTSKKKKKKILILGDSVTMGVGVDGDSTFVGKLQAYYCDSLQIDNLSLIGYNVNDYERILNTLNKEKKIADYDEIIIFWCLNDNYLHAKNTTATEENKVQSFFLTHSYLYCWLIKSRSDASLNYFNNDCAYYEDPASLKNLNDKISSIEKIRASKKTCIIALPYESQLRNFQAVDLFPQRVLAEMMKGHPIGFKDCTTFLKSKSENSKDLYLYADGIHFSNEGHQAVFEYLLKNLPLN